MHSNLKVDSMTLKSLFFICFLTIVTISCKNEDCGCDGEPMDSLKEAEVTLKNDTGEPLIQTQDSNLYDICNKSIVTTDLLDSLKNYPTIRIKINIDGDLYNECVEGRRVVGPYVNIKSLRKINSK